MKAGAGGAEAGILVTTKALAAKQAIIDLGQAIIDLDFCPLPD